MLIKMRKKNELPSVDLLLECEGCVPTGRVNPVHPLPLPGRTQRRNFVDTQAPSGEITSWW
jgi:hypothetical protein